MAGLLLMTEAERFRKVIFEAVRERKLSLAGAAERLEISYRHSRRVFARYRDQGDPGLVHKNRGRPSNRARPAAFRDAVLARYKERYAGFGPTLAAEKLTYPSHNIIHGKDIDCAAKCHNADTLITPPVPSVGPTKGDDTIIHQ